MAGRELTARHEAGHAVMCAVVGREVRRVVLTEDNYGGGFVGMTEVAAPDHENGRRALRETLMISAAGRITEARP